MLPDDVLHALVPHFVSALWRTSNMPDKTHLLAIWRLMAKSGSRYISSGNPHRGEILKRHVFTALSSISSRLHAVVKGYLAVVLQRCAKAAMHLQSHLFVLRVQRRVRERHERDAYLSLLDDMRYGHFPHLLGNPFSHATHTWDASLGRWR
eukprot:4649723-Prymnesium_polylepis.2